MSDISLLPEELRKKEEQLKKTEPHTPESVASDLKFFVPPEEGEDVEVIEIDEGEVDHVLAGEPFISRAMYRAGVWFQDFKANLFHLQTHEPPPKLPPQFFTPPVKAGEGLKSVRAEEMGKPKARIIPAEKTPRRVRVIRRVRKPVRVSFVSEEELQLLRVDVPKRRFTFITISVLFVVILAGGFFALSELARSAFAEQMAADRQLADVRSQIKEKQGMWSSFQDLEPKLRALIGLLNAHVSPTRLLERIERTTLPTVQYDLFSLTPDHKISLGVVTNSFESAAEQIVAFQKSGFVKKVDASGYTARYQDEDSPYPSVVSFQLTLSLADDAFRSVR